MKVIDIIQYFVGGILLLIGIMLVSRNPEGVNAVFEGLASLTERTVSAFSA